LECSPLGVIANYYALDWIEECSTFGGPVAFGSIGLDSMLTDLNAKKNGGFPYTSA